jgi:hypothetical protein
MLGNHSVYVCVKVLFGPVHTAKSTRERKGKQLNLTIYEAATGYALGLRYLDQMPL